MADPNKKPAMSTPAHPASGLGVWTRANEQEKPRKTKAKPRKRKPKK